MYHTALYTLYCTVTGWWLEALAQSTLYLTNTDRGCTVPVWRGLLKVHSTISSQADNTKFLSGGACQKYILPYQHRPKIQSLSGGACPSTPYQIITGRRYSVSIWRGLLKVHPTIPTQAKNTFSSGRACQKYILPY